MADYTSQYTGDQIEAILSSVGLKVAKADIATTLVDDDTVPIAASVAFDLNTAIQNLAETIGNNVVKLDGAQTITGAKAFTSSIAAREGIVVSANKFVTLATAEPTNDLYAVSRGYVKAHGVEAASAGVALKLTATTNGFQGFDFDPSELLALGAGISWSAVVLSLADQKPYVLTSSRINDNVYADSRWTALNSDYTNFKNTYSSDMTALNNAINARVLTTTYTAKMTLLDSADTARLLISTYTTDQTTLNTTLSNMNTQIGLRVLQTTYDTRQTAIDTSLATKMDYTPNGSATAAASGTAVLVSVPKGDIAYFLVTAIFTGTAKPAGYRVAVVCDGTNCFTYQDTLFAGPSDVTFSAVVSGSNIILSGANGSSTVSCTMRSKTLVRY